jgi:hypothetical protein
LPWDRFARLLLTASAFLPLALACGPTGEVSKPTPTEAPGQSIPTEGLPADIKCYLDHGIRLVRIDPPMAEGDRPGYVLESDLPAAEYRLVRDQCEKLAPAAKEQTDAEVRVIFDRWLKERECLIGLGYHPVEPPTFEKFLADWRSTGPWMPIDGIDTNAWTDADYQAAKKACTLEFFSRD